ncbi:hypothetical protein RCH14_002493 [Massilia sp. MP_M2]
MHCWLDAWTAEPSTLRLALTKTASTKEIQRMFYTV